MNRETAGRIVGGVVLLGLIGCPPPPVAFEWNLPPNFPEPAVPDDNPMSAEKVELGRHLFFDKRLSGNSKQSCGSCHEQAKAFTDGKARAVGSTEEVHPRSAMAITNVAYAPTLGWANAVLVVLERQALVPMFGERPVELGLREEAELLARLVDDANYPALFSAAFPDADGAISLDHVTKGLAAFERTIISGRSTYDRYVSGEGPLSDAEKRGMQMFFSEEQECYHCHGGFNFTDAVRFAGGDDVKPFHNNGLYNVDGNGAYPAENAGLFDITGEPEDMGRFKAPTLRNIAVTAPYMHDGSIATLSEVIDHYAAGGRTIVDGDNAGVGKDSPIKSGLVRGFALTDDQKADLLAFLEALTDDEFLTDPRFADPFLQAP